MYYYLIAAFLLFMFWVYSPRIYRPTKRNGFTYFVATLPSFFIGFCLLLLMTPAIWYVTGMNALYNWFKKSIYGDEEV